MSIWHLVILAVVVLLIFGTGKLSKLGPDLGAAIRDFKKNLNGDDEEAKRQEAASLRAEAQPSGGNKTQRPDSAHADSK